jgi:hypothetical protein
MALATSYSVDPNRSPVTLVACLMAVVIFAMCSWDVIGPLLYASYPASICVKTRATTHVMR